MSIQLFSCLCPFTPNSICFLGVLLAALPGSGLAVSSKPAGADGMSALGAPMISASPDKRGLGVANRCVNISKLFSASSACIKLCVGWLCSPYSPSGH